MHIIGVEYRHTMSQYYECNRSYVAVCGVVWYLCLCMYNGFGFVCYTKSVFSILETALLISWLL